MELLILAGAILVHAAVAFYQAQVIKDKKLPEFPNISGSPTKKYPVKNGYVSEKHFEIPIDETGSGKLDFNYEVGDSNLQERIELEDERILEE